MAVSCLASPCLCDGGLIELVEFDCVKEAKCGVEGERESPDNSDISESVSSCVCKLCSPAEAHQRKPS